MSPDPGALLARKTWRTVEPLHGMIYFVPEAAEAYERLGITGRAGYFASRAAPMGAVAAEVVVATFFNFNPDLVRAAIPRAWDITTPRSTRERSPRSQSTVRSAACSGTMCSSLGPWTERPNWPVGLAETAGTQVEGRPLSAAHAELPWPDPPHLVLWHAQSILREFRGDGHVALLAHARALGD